MNTPILDTPPGQKSRLRRTVVSVLVVSLAVHAVIGVGAGVWVIARYFSPPPAVFESKRVIAIPPQIIDPAMASAELEGAAPRPTMDEKIASLRETDFALPDLPKVPMDQVTDFDPSAVVTDSAGLGSGFGGSGTGSGGGGGGGGGDGLGTGISFFGIKGQARSVVIMFDVSKSVQTKAEKAGVPITAIRDETTRLIEGLSINTTFNLVQFSRIYQPMAPEMQPPSDAGKAMAKKWLETEFRTDGMLPRSVRGSRVPAAGGDNGIAFILDGVLAMKPDMIFLISDGSFQSDLHAEQVPWKELEELVDKHRKLGTQTKINFIGFEMKPEDKKEMRSIVRKTDGTLKEIGRD
ncbi:MAG: hypothetical protein SFU85_01395 [Candidatus Methylacidiphilales bacterium]|nr:hypothetical protein [Candidatus Methylacidiphilales bacterium]